MVEHPWLFDEGRLIGGKPVPGVGWIFTPRLPDPGPKSRRPRPRRAKAIPNRPGQGGRVGQGGQEGGQAPAKKALAKWPTDWPMRRGAAAGARRPAPGQGETATCRAPFTRRWPRPSTPSDGHQGCGQEDGATEGRSQGKAKARKATKKKDGGRSRRLQEGRGGQEGGTAKKAEPAKKASAAKKRPATKQASRPRRAPAASKPAKKGGAEAGAARSRRPRPRPPIAKSRRQTPPPAVNEPLSFINFVAAYPVGTTVEGEVVSFTSHGAMVDVAAARGRSPALLHPAQRHGRPAPDQGAPGADEGRAAAVRADRASTRPGGWPSWPCPRPPAKKRRGPGQEGGRGLGLKPPSITSAHMEPPAPADVLPHRPPFLFVTAVDGGRARAHRRRAAGSSPATSRSSRAISRAGRRCPACSMVESLAQLGGIAVLLDPAVRGQAAAVRRDRASPVPAPGGAGGHPRARGHHGPPVGPGRQGAWHGLGRRPDGL